MMVAMAPVLTGSDRDNSRPLRDHSRLWFPGSQGETWKCVCGELLDFRGLDAGSLRSRSREVCG